jgi:transcription elongation factor Elf1
MFEDEIIDIACPKCSHKSSVLLREIDGKNESHIACEKCKVLVKVEARGFQQRIDQVRMELENIQREANFENPRPRRVKDDYQI